MQSKIWHEVYNKKPLICSVFDLDSIVEKVVWQELTCKLQIIGWNVLLSNSVKWEIVCDKYWISNAIFLFSESLYSNSKVVDCSCLSASAP